MFFIALIVNFAHQSNEPLSMTDSCYVHAAILRLLSRVGPQAAQDLHRCNSYQPFTTAIVDSTPKRSVVRVTFIAQAAPYYANLLASALPNGQVVKLGRLEAQILGIDFLDPRWSKVCTWADLTRPAEGRHIQFNFHTPTAIMKHGFAGKRYSSIFPDPADVFHGLVRKWQAFSGPALPAVLGDFIEAGGCYVCDYRLETRIFKTIERTQIGFIGTVGYEVIDAEGPFLQTLNSLSRFAQFSGVGYQTARGMGCVSARITN